MPTSSAIRRARAQAVMTAVVLTVAIAPALPSVAQNPPPPEAAVFSGPVRETTASPIDLRHLRVHLSIDPREHVIRGRLVADMQRTGAGPAQLFVNPEAVALESIRATWAGSPNESDLAWTTAGDSLFVSLPDSLPVVFVLMADYVVLRGLRTDPLGARAGPWEAVYAIPGEGAPDWLPFAPGIGDRFSAELRLTLPSDWTAIVAGVERFRVEVRETKTVGSLFDSLTVPPQLGFVALREPSYTSENGRLVVQDAQSDTRPLEEALISISRMERFFAERIGLEPPDVTTRVVFGGLAEAASTGAGLAIFPRRLLPDGTEAVEEDFELASAVARDWVESFAPLRSWTDVWIHEALPPAMAARYVRDRHGEAAYAQVLWECRQRYLEEAREYVRPLVWDRWDAPSDLVDWHARCKGMWLFHMLSAESGASLIWTAFRHLAELGIDEAGVSSEEMRTALERASGRDLTGFFDQWVYSAGHPVLGYDYQVAVDQESVRVGVTQRQDGFLVPEAFTLEIDVESGSLAGVDRARIRVQDASSTATVDVRLRPQYVRLDPDGRLLFEYAEPPDPVLLVSSLRRLESEAARYFALAQLLDGEVDATLLIGLRPSQQATASAIEERLLTRTIAAMAPSATAFRQVLATARDTASSARATAVRSLVAFPDEPDARRTALDAANSASDPLVLAAAVEALVALDASLARRVIQSAMVTDAPGNIVRRTALRILPTAPVDDEFKISTLLTAFSDRGDPQLRHAALEALTAFPDVTRVRSAALASWAVAGYNEREAILDIAFSSVPSRREREVLSYWSSVEPEYRLRRRLEAALDTQPVN